MIKTTVSSMLAVLITPGNNYLVAQVPVLTVPAVTGGGGGSTEQHGEHLSL